MLLLKIFLLQAAVFAVIFAVLRSILDRILKESAIRRVELWEVDGQATLLAPLEIISHKELATAHKQRLVKAVIDKFGGQTKIAFTKKRAIMGGLVIKIGGQSIVFSIQDRLRQAMHR